MFKSLFSKAQRKLNRHERRARKARSQAAHFTGLEPLEDRVLLSTTLFLDFGAGIGMGNTFSTTVEDYAEIDGTGDNGDGTGADLTSQGMADGDSLDMTPLAYDFNLDGVINNTDLTALANAVVPIVQRTLEPFDVNVQVVNDANSLNDMLNNFDGNGQNDAYNVIMDIRSDAFGGGSVGNNVNANLLFGLAAADDLNDQDGNNQDEATLTFADTVFSTVTGTQGTAQFNQNLAFRLAYTATHEAFHTFSFVHSTTLVSSGDVIRLGSNTRENPFMVTRFDLTSRQNGFVVAEPNNYILAKNELGLRDSNSDGTPNLAYVTGTGAHDEVFLNDDSGDIDVDVNAYSNTARTNLLAGETYDVILGTDTEGEVLADAGINNDHVRLDATIDTDFRLRGGTGIDGPTTENDLLTLQSGGLSGTFTPGADGINGNVVYSGGADVDFSEFENVEADNVSIDTINLSLSSGNAVDEGEAFTLDVDFVNIDTLDSHDIVVDWGNGDTSMITLSAGDRDHTFNYTYVDDHPNTGTALDGFTINVMITDDDDDSGSTNAGIVVNNIAPQITSINLSSASINEADSVTVTGTFLDPALDVSTEIFTGTALWSDGVATALTVDGINGTFSTTRTFLDDHPMTGTPSDNFTVNITINDDDTGTDTGTSSVLTVFNVDPVIASFASDATFEDKGEEGEPVNIMADFTDIGILDTHTAVVDWGDGSAPEMVTVIQGAGSGMVTGSHIYTNGGVYVVTLTLTDDDTGTDVDTTLAVITGVGVNNGVLYIVGSNEDDNVHVNQNGKGQIKVHASFIDEPFREYDSSQVNEIISYLCNGDDHFTISNKVTTPAIVHGGAGNDHLHGGGGASVLLGDEGNDTLVGQFGRNIMIGGTGLDILIGGKTEDVLIGGSADVATDSEGLMDEALMEALVEWADETQPYAARVASMMAAFTVVDDLEADELSGSASQDLFYAGLEDVITDLELDETVL